MLQHPPELSPSVHKGNLSAKIPVLFPVIAITVVEAMLSFELYMHNLLMNDTWRAFGMVAISISKVWYSYHLCEVNTIPSILWLSILLTPSKLS